MTRVEGETVAIDTCSMNGTKIDGQRIRMATLEHGTTCELSHLRLTWRNA